MTFFAKESKETFTFGEVNQMMRVVLDLVTEEWLHENHAESVQRGLYSLPNRPACLGYENLASAFGQVVINRIWEIEDKYGLERIE